MIKQNAAARRRRKDGAKTFWLTTMMLPTAVWLLLTR